MIGSRGPRVTREIDIRRALKLATDVGEHSVDVFIYPVVPVSLDAIAMVLEVSRAFQVVAQAPFVPVWLTVELNDQFRINADEVDDEGPEGLLASKLHPSQATRPQCAPELPLGIRLSASELSGKRVLHDWTIRPQ